MAAAERLIRWAAQMGFEALVVGIAVASVPFAASDPRAARWLASGTGTVLVTLSACLAAALASFLGTNLETRYSLLLLAPIPQLALVRVAYGVFKRVQRREPVDVWLNFSPGLGADRLFAIVVTAGGILPLLPLIAPR